MAYEKLVGLFILALVFGVMIAFSDKKKKSNGRMVLLFVCLMMAGLVRWFDAELSRPLSGLLYHLVGVYGFALSLLWLTWKANVRMNRLLAKRAKVRRSK